MKRLNTFFSSIVGMNPGGVNVDDQALPHEVSRQAAFQQLEAMMDKLYAKMQRNGASTPTSES